jgi:hypothetical protein
MTNRKLEKFLKMSNNAEDNQLSEEVEEASGGFRIGSKETID